MSGAREILFHFAFLILPTEDIKLNSLTAVTSNANRPFLSWSSKFLILRCALKYENYIHIEPPVVSACSLINGVWPSSRALDSGAGGRGSILTRVAVLYP